MTFTQPVCYTCWDAMHPNRRPTRLAEGVREREVCCKCGNVTYSGIYIRINPATVPHPRHEPPTA